MGKKLVGKPPRASKKLSTRAAEEQKSPVSEARQKKAGRPRGRKSDPVAVVETIAAACPSCGSTEKWRIRTCAEREIPGVSPAGRPRSHVVWRRCRCKGCHRYYVEITHEKR